MITVTVHSPLRLPFSSPFSHLGHSHLLRGLLRRPPQLSVAFCPETPFLQVQVRHVTFFIHRRLPVDTRWSFLSCLVQASGLELGLIRTWVRLTPNPGPGLMLQQKKKKNGRFGPKELVTNSRTIWDELYQISDSWDLCLLNLPHPPPPTPRTPVLRSAAVRLLPSWPLCVNVCQQTSVSSFHSLTRVPFSRRQGPREQPALPAQTATGAHVAAGGPLRRR